MPECFSCKGTAETGACPYCRKRLKKMLRELVAFVDLLNSSPSLRQQVSSQQEGRGSMSHSLVINVQIVDLISKTGIPAILAAWSEYVIAERSLDPSSIYATKEETKLHKMRNLLSIHNDYLAESELWHDYYYEIKEPWKILSRIIHGERKPPKPVKCPVQDCVGYLHLESNGDVHCVTDSTHKWTYDEWSRLALLITK